jgi:hypothetical protein
MTASPAVDSGKPCCNGCGKSVDVTKIGDVRLCPQCISRAAVLTGLKAS